MLNSAAEVLNSAVHAPISEEEMPISAEEVPTWLSDASTRLEHWLQALPEEVSEGAPARRLGASSTLAASASAAELLGPGGSDAAAERAAALLGERQAALSKHASEQEVARLAEEVHALRSSLRSAVWVAPELELAPPPPPPPRRHRPAPKDDANDGAHRREDPGTPATSETDLLGWLFGLDPQWAEAGEYTCFAR